MGLSQTLPMVSTSTTAAELKSHISESTLFRVSPRWRTLGWRHMLFQYPPHDHINRFFGREAMGHQRLHLLLVDAPDGGLVSHLGERVSNVHDRNGTCNCPVPHDLHAVHMAPRASSGPFGDACCLCCRIVLDGDPRLDDASGVFTIEEHLVFDGDPVDAMS